MAGSDYDAEQDDYRVWTCTECGAEGSEAEMDKHECEKSTNKLYLGDGVFAETCTDDAIVLTTNNGIRDTNRIVLEMAVLLEFKEYLRRWMEGR